MSLDKMIVTDAVKVGREVVARGFWNRHKALTRASAAEVSRAGTLWYADLGALEELVGRKLTKNDHRLWELTLRAELMRLAPVTIR